MFIANKLTALSDCFFFFFIFEGYAPDWSGENLSGVFQPGINRADLLCYRA